MKLYLVRHGNAVQMDEMMLRPLSLEGQDEIARLTHFLAKKPLRVTHVFHSSKLRAQQTAEILAKKVNDGQCEYLAGLEPDDPTLPMIKMINSWTEDTMLVGHMPFMGKLTNQLLGLDEGPTIVNFKTGTIVCLTNKNYDWQINWILNPAMSL